MHNPVDWSHTKAITTLDLSHGFASNFMSMIYNPIYFEPGEVYSQVTNWDMIEESVYSSEVDSNCYILDDSTLAFDMRIDGNVLFVQGPITQLEQEVLDRRWSLLGNIGLWYRFALYIQEIQGIFSLHAAAIYKPSENELMVVVGKAGSGKTVFLLEAIKRGYQVFSTEMTYFSFIPEGIRFYRGALYDNIRVGTLVYDFPDVMDRIGIEPSPVKSPWDHKISVDMRRLSTAQAELDNPNLSFVFPRIEKGIDRVKVKEISTQPEFGRMLFGSASEKIGATFMLYEYIPIPGLDSYELAGKRWEAISALVSGDKWKIKQAKSTLAGPNNCMEGIDQ